MKKSYIKFYTNEKDYTNTSNRFFITFDDSIDTLHKALVCLEKSIRYPKRSISGPSIDAIIDILSSNFYAMEGYEKLTLIHNNLPKLSEKDLYKYVNLLNTSVFYTTKEHWDKYSTWAKTHEYESNYLLKVFFPLKSKELIESMIPHDVVSW